jgi:hypothetical protein
VWAFHPLSGAISSTERLQCDGRFEEITTMKKLIPLMLGCALAFGCVSATFAQDTTKKEKKAKTKKAKKKNDKK